ncbi:flagellin [Aeromonas veronii]|uniref:flagellin N-terminal helical domain-containing protein n=1 Tax=Aeromonas veronii TaxID=654 RepID=UPI00214D1E54|nr:flagellin [Aeromonas veronii]MCR3971100.1 flagellin [Aeromonas veronii]MCR3975425.1 flagellin [Aeromonas veronii]
MSLSIHTNFAAMVTQNQLASTNKLASTAMQRLGTGMRINSAADDAAGLQIATRLQSQSNSQKTGMRNAQDAISMMQTAEGAMDEMTNIVQRMKDLATQAANGTSSDKDIAAMNAEFGELTKELKNIAGNTTFGGENLLDSTNGKFAKGKVTFQIGGTDKETLTVDIGETLKKVVGGAAMSATDAAAFAAVTSPETDLASAQTDLKTTQDDYAPLKEAEDKAKRIYDADKSDATAKTKWEDAKKDADKKNAEVVTAQIKVEDKQKALNTVSAAAMTAGSGLDSGTLKYGLQSQEHAQKAIGELESFMQDITSVRSAFGANINRLEHTVNNLSNMKENTDIAKGRIMDADFATESTNMTKNQMLMQAGMSVLGQANQMTGMVTGLLR